MDVPGCAGEKENGQGGQPPKRGPSRWSSFDEEEGHGNVVGDVGNAAATSRWTTEVEQVPTHQFLCS